MTKICTKCGEEYPATTEFFNARSGGPGLRPTCKNCQYQFYNVAYRRPRPMLLAKTRRLITEGLGLPLIVAADLRGSEPFAAELIREAKGS